jgi:uncharacterized protein
MISRRTLMGAALSAWSPVHLLAQLRSKSVAKRIHLADAKLAADPIDPKQIISGNPQAANFEFSTSADSRETSGVWSCARGSFHWTFDTDETAIILEGQVTVQMENGATLHLGPGDLAFFSSGQKCIWTVEKNLREVYILYKNG